MKKRCPGMDPANFKPEDIKLRPCPKCGEELEFWKDDVCLTCPECGTKIYNTDLENACVCWCDKADKCLGNDEINEWKKRRGKE